MAPIFENREMQSRPVNPLAPRRNRAMGSEIAHRELHHHIIEIAREYWVAKLVTNKQYLAIERRAVRRIRARMAGSAIMEDPLLVIFRQEFFIAISYLLERWIQREYAAAPPDARNAAVVFVEKALGVHEVDVEECDHNVNDPLQWGAKRFIASSHYVNINLLIIKAAAELLECRQSARSAAAKEYLNSNNH